MRDLQLGPRGAIRHEERELPEREIAAGRRIVPCQHAVGCVRGPRSARGKPGQPVTARSSTAPSFETRHRQVSPSALSITMVLASEKSELMTVATSLP